MKLAINGGKPLREKDFHPWPVWSKREEELLIEVLNSGRWGSLHGKKTKEFEELFKNYHNSKFGIAVSSGTTGLYASLRALGLEPGDEVILPAYTFLATASTILEIGGIPIFADIDPHTYTLSPESVMGKITRNTKGLIPVHLGGHPADMSTLKKIAEQNSLFILEDSAQAWGSEWEERKVGAIGDCGVFSFQSSKNITAGEGGIILTNNEVLAERIASYVNCGRMPSKIWYEHYLLGSNFRITEFQSAILIAQLERYEEMRKKREENALYLSKKLSEIEGIRPLSRDERVTAHAYHLFIIRYDKKYFMEIPREKVIRALNAEGIPVYPGYSIPLYKQPVFNGEDKNKIFKTLGVDINYNDIHLPITENACYEEAIWLNQRVLLGEREDINDIVNAFIKIKENLDELISLMED
ncbi:MAG: DegT/DnrJ/EryC1/StrS family aminotransferase [Candidatus Aminicenantia bacterium]